MNIREPPIPKKPVNKAFWGYKKIMGKEASCISLIDTGEMRKSITYAVRKK